MVPIKNIFFDSDRKMMEMMTILPNYSSTFVQIGIDSCHNFVRRAQIYPDKLSHILFHFRGNTIWGISITVYTYNNKQKLLFSRPNFAQRTSIYRE